MLLKQSELFGLISRSYENVMKSGTIKITEDLVEARMHAGWVLKFLRNHERLSREYGEEIKIKDHHIHEIFDKTDEAYHIQKGQYFHLL